MVEVRKAPFPINESLRSSPKIPRLADEGHRQLASPRTARLKQPTDSQSNKS
jgi:hypothetical protein